MQVFLRVVESRSFVRAADSLGLPASSVTDLIKRLEKHLQARLLNRSTRNLSLTPDGELYLYRCREILDLIDDIEPVCMVRRAPTRATAHRYTWRHDACRDPAALG